MSQLEELRASYRPDRITTLFVGESAPASGRFFYSANSSLYHAMRRAFGGETTFLEDFKTRGFYLDDLVREPVNKLARQERSRLRWASIDGLSERLTQYRPTAVVIVMRAIKPMIRDAMRKAGILYEPFCAPHPAFGNWTRFHSAMTEIIHSLPA
jgi:hypothetical protein